MCFYCCCSYLGHPFDSRRLIHSLESTPYGRQLQILLIDKPVNTDGNFPHLENSEKLRFNAKTLSRFSDCWKMEKVPRSPVLRATPFICLLLLCLLYTVDFEFNVTRSDQWENQTQLEATGFACDSKIHTDICVSSKPVRIDTVTMKVYAPFSQGMPPANPTLHPYAIKNDKALMNTTVTSVQILLGNITLSSPCQYTHNVTAVIFSFGGYAQNLFHEFNEVIIPLFLTSRHFQSRLHFIVTDFRSKVVAKYKKILFHLSSYEVINPALNRSMHCFPGAVVGLHYHDHLAISNTTIPKGYSMLDFKQFLRESYNLKKQDLSQMEKPVLVLISRKKSRMFLNEDEILTMMRALGFTVVVAKPGMMRHLNTVAEMLNACSVLVGAHGAGLTTAVFLPEGAVMVQVVGLGLEWFSDNYFGGPARGMGLNYLEYKIEAEESSLVSFYGRDHPVITDPASLYSQGYKVGRAMYLKRQNFNIDVVRFRMTLVNALGLLGRSAPLVS
ncbi:hypothetical protein RHSIM_Rhsim06G0221100 [Rhododendron simsii]|uniref:Glycosyltransferase 61 catalytic domain-containing protein n=1 Tax=Rhododendron simsii TaxID=118357 RepID=A0A834GXD9_RHOSS|nr:hypothetical protein RHSIM_Rhsim06G0221100 [Rhododendron simsii]